VREKELKRGRQFLKHTLQSGPICNLHLATRKPLSPPALELEQLKSVYVKHEYYKSDSNDLSRMIIRIRGSPAKTKNPRKCRIPLSRAAMRAQSENGYAFSAENGLSARLDGPDTFASFLRVVSRARPLLVPPFSRFRSLAPALVVSLFRFHASLLLFRANQSRAWCSGIGKFLEERCRGRTGRKGMAARVAGE